MSTFWGRLLICWSGILSLYCAEHLVARSFVAGACLAVASLGLYAVGVALTERGPAQP